MYKKREMLKICFSIIFLSWIMPLISAADFGYFFEQGMNDVIESVKGFTSPFFASLLNVSTYDQYFFSKILVLILLYVVIYAVTKHLKFVNKDQTFVRFIIAAVISVLGVRYISDSDFFSMVLLPYGVLAVAITVGLTFMIFGFFIHDLPGAAARRMGWILYLAIFIGMWINRFSDLSEGANITYALGLVLVTVSIVFDRKIHEYFGLRESREAERNMLRDRLSEIEYRLSRFRSITTPSAHVQASIANLEKAQSEAIRALSRL